MLLNIEDRTNLFVNPSSLNYTFKNRKRYIRKQETAKKCFSPKFIEEKISSTEHLNILNEYQDELKYLSLNKKNSESPENSQIIKDSSTRDTDIVICVESNSQEPNDKIDDNDNSELKKFKLQNYNDDENKLNIINLFNLRNSLINKSGSNYSKISNLIDVAANELKKPVSYTFKNDNNKNSYENIKKMINLNFEDNGMIKKLINKFYHFDFKQSNVEKLVEKINNILIKQNSFENKFQNDKFNINHSINHKNIYKNKRDSNSYPLTLIEKMNNNKYESAFSLTNDTDYMNSIKYISNKFSTNGDKMENSLIKAMKLNKKLLEDFKNKNKEIADKYDKCILKKILRNKKIRKKVKLNFGFIKKISEKNFYKFLDKNYLINPDSLMNEKENKNIFKNINKSENYNFLFFAYFLLGINYIDKYKLNLSENELFSLIQCFLKFGETEKNGLNKNKKEKNKIMKLKGIKKEKKNNNIIRLNLEEIFGKKSENENLINLIEENENLNEV